MRKVGEVIKNRVAVTMAAIVAVIIAIIVCNSLARKENKVATITDPETLRAMSYEQVTEEDANVEGVENIKFSAYFLRDLDGDGYAEKYKGTCTRINTSDSAELNKRLLYIDFNVLGDGKFKDGVITINNKNFTWKTTIAADNIVDQSYNGDINEIVLNDELLGGSQKLFSGAIFSDIKDNINNYTQISSVTLTGTYVNDEGIETPVSKTINLTVDWYGITKTVVNKDNVVQTKDIATLIKDKKVQIRFDAINTETEEELLLQKQVVVVRAPEFNGYKPTNVYATYDRVEQSYNSETCELTITNNANVTQNGDIQVKISRSNRYEIVAEYPLEAYTSMQNESLSIDIPIIGYNYGFNNKNTEFVNPYASVNSNIITVKYQDISDDVEIHNEGSIVPQKPVLPIWTLNISVGDFIYSSETGGKSRVSKEPIIQKYNGNAFENIEDTYTVTWDVTISKCELMSKIILEEQVENEGKKSDKFLNSNGQLISMKDYESTIGITFLNAGSVLASDGYINLYNAETDTLITTFTRENWNEYYKINIDDVKSIKIETSVPIGNGTIRIKQTKKIDDEKIIQDFSREEFGKLRYIYSYVKGRIEAKTGKTLSGSATTLSLTCSNYAHYEESVSIQSISISPNQMINQETNNVEIQISTKSENSFEKKWVNGVFLIEMPEDIVYVKVNDITSSSENLQIRNWSTYEENGKHYIKIYTSSNIALLYDINIDVDLTANPLNPTRVETIKLYAYNPNCNNYYNNTRDIYDVDEDFSNQDVIGYATTELTTVAPSGISTVEYITDYNENNNVTVAPNVAEIEKSDGARTATVNIGLVNNYTGTISDVSILGRLPFEGNKYILINRDMKSEFTAYITGPINIPESQVNNVIIYYSANENATNDLSDTSNGWITAENVSDWTLIKSYLIDFGDHIFSQEAIDTFTYELEIPAGVGYDEAAFCNHAVFYTLDTENGKLEMQTEPNRVGVQVVGKYNLELEKNKLRNINTKVNGATYKIEGQDANGDFISKLATTDVYGKLVFNDLYIGRKYILEEVSCPEDYELSTEKIGFTTSVDNDGNLIVNIINDNESGTTGNFADNPEITTDNNGNYIVKTRLEDEAKWTLNISKFNENDETIQGVQFLFGVDGFVKTFVTNNNGKTVISGLSLDKEYIIREIKADGYYVDNETKIIKLVKTVENGEEILRLECNDDKYSNATIEYPNDVAQTQVNVKVTNERVPTYKLQILKVNKTEREEEIIPLPGTTFRLGSVDTGKQEEYVTDENGIIEIDGLYINIEGKSITGEYTLQETKAPTGYTNSAEQISFIVNGSYNEQNQAFDLEVNVSDSEQYESLKEIKIEDNVLKIIIQDRPLFKLTKIDSETGEVLANVQFIIYKIEDDGSSDYAKDEYGNYLGTIDEDGNYIVTTDENGVITLPLPNGTYCAVEVTYPEGYQEKSEYEYFKIGEDGEAEGEDEGEDEEQNHDDIEINYIEDLVDLSNNVSNGNNYNGTNIKLTRTLDFQNPDSYRSGEVDESLISGDGFMPIGKNYNNHFGGNFNGQGNEIRNLYISGDASNKGLFGYIYNSQITNLGVSGSVNSSTGKYTGTVIGYAAKSMINNCYNTGSANGNKDVFTGTGGIVGYASNCTVSNCYNTGNISGYYTGGITGEALECFINNCYNAGEISTKSEAGGIVGKLEGGAICLCHNDGTIRGSDSGGAKIGGIVGEADSSSVDRGNIINSCYNTGNIINNYGSAGGIIGYKFRRALIYNCYNIGNIRSTTTGDGDSVVGGIIGNLYWNTSSDDANNTIKNCYYLNTSELTGKQIKLIGIAKTEEEMKTLSFVEILGTNNWKLDEGNVNNGFPIFETCVELEGNNDVIEINYIEDLVDLSNSVNYGGFSYVGKKIVLMRDLDFNDNNSYRDATSTRYGDYNQDGMIESIKLELTSGSGFIPINMKNAACFKGSFDGQGYEIRNIYINTENEYAGLFGFIYDAEIKNLGISGSVKGYIYAGGIVGKISKSTVSNCYNTGNVSSSYKTGGIIGESADSTISNSYNTGDISSSSDFSDCHTGGICGYASNSTLDNCYNTGEINNYCNCREYIEYTYYYCCSGGIVGYAKSITVTNCSNTGLIVSDTIKENYDNSGGICGYAKESEISTCNNNGQVYGGNTGGICGAADKTPISICYNIGQVCSTLYNTTRRWVRWRNSWSSIYTI